MRMRQTSLFLFFRYNQIDPACGTGGFIIQCLIELKDRYPSKEKDISRWAQLHIYGIDKDAIGIKLTKAIMQILGDGSAQCVRGDRILTHTWRTKYPHLLINSFKDGRFTKVFTNPPFGAPLKVEYTDAKKSWHEYRRLHRNWIRY